MAVDLFAGIPVRDYGTALAWYETLFGPPSFIAHDTKAVSELADRLRRRSTLTVASAHRRAGGFRERSAGADIRDRPCRPGRPRLMAKGDVETYHQDGQWKNRPEGNQRASSVHDTKAEAEATGRDMAKQRDVEHVIKKQDGTIGEKNTYPRSSDPREIPG